MQVESTNERSLAAQATPLFPVYAVSILNSMATTILSSAIYFLTERAYQFTRQENYILGVVMGIAYIAGSLAAGPLLKLTRARGVPDRTVLFTVVASMGLICVVPFIFRHAASSWPIWVHISIYSPLGGVLWPIVESYLSGGREGPGLRRALGWWNVAWSSAGFIGAVVVSPLLSEHAIAAIMIFGGVQAISLPFVAMYSRMPGAHHADAPRERPLVFKQLLVTFRILLPAAYVVMNTLMPYLPSAMKGIEVGGGWKTGLVAVYLLSRALTFLLLEVWTKWHGRWSLAVVGGSLLLGGFGVTVMAPTLGPGIGLAVMIAGLISFGMGMSAIYVGAIYYAMEVAHSEVDAGGAHEALIGVGYMGGPLCGLIAGLLFSGPNFEPALLGMAGLVGTGATLLVVARIPRKGKPQERLVRNNG